MEIRKATPNNARRISYLIQKNTEKVLENNYSKEQITIWKKANTPKAIEKKMNERTIFCAFQHKKLVGTIGLYRNNVVGLYVSYSKRKLGIGKKLLEHLEQQARKQGIQQLILTSTPSGKKFYISNGYQPIQPITVDIMGVPFEETEMMKTI